MRQSGWPEDRSGDVRAAPTVSERITEVDYLRGLAIIGVILVHTSAHFAHTSGLSLLVVTNVIIDVVAHYAVPLFVLLSGFTLALRYAWTASATDWRAFLTRRLKTILPPYLLFSVIYLIVTAYQYGAPSPREIVFALLTGSAYYHLWFVVMLIQLYLLFPLLLLVMERAVAHGRAGWLLLAALMFQWAWNIGTLYALDTLPATPFYQTILSYRIFLSHILYFVIGIAAGLGWAVFRPRLERIPTWPLVVIAAVLTLVTVSVWLTAIDRYGSLAEAPQRHFSLAMLVEPALYLTIAALLWKSVHYLRTTPVPVRSFLLDIGALSFGIYLIHVVFQMLLAFLMELSGVTYLDWAFYPAMFAGTLALSYVTVRLLSRLPFAEYTVGVRR